MDCKAAYSLMKQFHSRNMKSDQALEFIEHVSECRSCKEDLSIFYIIDACNDDSEPSTYDFMALVDEDMRGRKKQINAHTNYVVFKMVLWTGANLVVFLNLLSWVMRFFD